MPATRPRSFRLSAHELDRVERIAEHLNCSQGAGVALAALLLEEKLGLRRQAGVELAERLARQHGDQAPSPSSCATTSRTGYFADRHRRRRARRRASRRGSRWRSARSDPASATWPPPPCTCATTRASTTCSARSRQPVEGDQITVTVADLPDLVVERSRARTDREWRENLAMDLKLRGAARRRG